MGTSPKSSRKAIVLLAAVSLLLFSTILVLLFLARQSSSTHYNLSYLMWKNGLKAYDSTVALPGLFHDHSFREEMSGMSMEEFEDRFPSTFYEVVTPPPIAKPSQRYFISDYHQAKRKEGGFALVWVAIFSDDRLLELNYAKG